MRSFQDELPAELPLDEIARHWSRDTGDPENDVLQRLLGAMADSPRRGGISPMMKECSDGLHAYYHLHINEFLDYLLYHRLPAPSFWASDLEIEAHNKHLERLRQEDKKLGIGTSMIESTRKGKYSALNAEIDSILQKEGVDMPFKRLRAKLEKMAASEHSVILKCDDANVHWSSNKKNSVTKWTTIEAGLKKNRDRVKAKIQDMSKTLNL